MRVWTAKDFVVMVPLLVERAQHAEGAHELPRQKHVVNDTLEVKPTTRIDNTSSTNAIITEATLHHLVRNATTLSGSAMPTLSSFLQLGPENQSEFFIISNTNKANL